MFVARKHAKNIVVVKLLINKTLEQGTRNKSKMKNVELTQLATKYTQQYGYFISL